MTSSIVAARRICGLTWKPELPQIVERLPLRARLPRVPSATPIGYAKNESRRSRGQRRIELTDAAGRGVARIGENRREPARFARSLRRSKSLLRR